MPPAPSNNPRSIGLGEAVQLLATLAGAGALLGALLFGIGYVAVKQRDVMLGLITTTSYSEYVRAGAVFFPRSVHALAEFLRSPPARWYRVGLAVIFGVTALVGLVRSTRRFQDFVSSAEDVFAAKREHLVFTAYGVAVAACYSLFGPLMAPLSPINTSLLVSQLRDTASAGAHADSLLFWEDSARIVEQYRRPGEIYVLLHSPENSVLLLEKYGEYCAWMVIIVFGALLIYRLRLSTRGRAGYWLTVSDWLIRPIFLVLLLVFVVTLPAVYGVLGIPQAFPCVKALRLIGADSAAAAGDSSAAQFSREFGGGHLLSDLSSDAGRVVVYAYEWQNNQYELTFLEPGRLESVIGTACTETNLLALTARERVGTLQDTMQATTRSLFGPDTAAAPADPSGAAPPTD